MGRVTSQRLWLRPNQRPLVLNTPGSASTACADLARWCWIAKKRHRHQRLSAMSTIIMAPLCSIYISNILRAFKCQLTGWLWICCAYVKMHITRPAPSRRSGHSDLVLIGEISWWEALVSDWSGHLEEEGLAIPSFLLLLSLWLASLGRLYQPSEGSW